MRLDRFELFDLNKAPLGIGYFIYFFEVPTSQRLEQTRTELCEANAGLVLLAYVVKAKEKSEPSRIFWKHPNLNFSSNEPIFTKELGKFLKLEFENVLNPGVFTDQVENRIFLEKWIKEKLVTSLLPNQQATALNLFSYTGAFSVLCASLGLQVTSVDVSSRYLEWEKQNHIMNQTLGLSRRLKNSAVDFAKRLKIDGANPNPLASYDVIVVDPPTFARDQKGKSFRVQKDLPPLLTTLLQHQNRPTLQKSPRLLFVSCNDETWPESRFLEIIQAQCQSVNPTLKVMKGFSIHSNADSTEKASGLRSAFVLSQS